MITISLSYVFKCALMLITLVGTFFVLGILILIIAQRFEGWTLKELNDELNLFGIVFFVEAMLIILCRITGAINFIK